jgi:hypothetical protein
VDVFLVPIGRGRYALYCEPGDDPAGGGPASETGFWRRMSDRFSDVLSAVEREHDAESHPGAPRPTGVWPRLRGRFVRWMAEKIAEQRLLWRLRGRSHVRTLIPSGLETDRALSIVRGNLARDFDRHRLWMVVDLLGSIVGLAMTPIPGPNLLGYYFTFRVVGHFFALRGARHGLTEVRWDFEASEPLADLCALDALPRNVRERRVQEVGRRLGLPRLARFYDRTASWGA